MARIVFISPYYPPEQGAAAVCVSENAIRLAKRGHKVTVLTTMPNYPTGIVPPEYRGHRILRETLEGVEVVRVWSYVSPNKGFWRRILAHTSFGFMAPLLGAGAVGQPDIIIVQSPPLFDAVAVRLLSWLKRCPYIFMVSDLWPASAVQLGALRNKLLIRLLEWLEWSTYQRAGKVWVVTEGIWKNLRQRGLAADRMFLVTNGVDTEKFRPLPQQQARAELGWDERFTVIYAGTHGLSHGLMTVLAAAEQLLAIQTANAFGRDKSFLAIPSDNAALGLALPHSNAALSPGIPKVNAALASSFAQTFGSEVSSFAQECGKEASSSAQSLGKEGPYEAQAVCNEGLASSDIRFVLVGDGAEKAHLVAEARRRNLINVTFLDPQPHERIPTLLAAADVCLVHVRNIPLFAGMLPIKMYEAMACARPILLAVDGEARQLATEEFGAAVYVEPENADALVSAIVSMQAQPELARSLGQRGRVLVQERFDYDLLVAALDEQILSLLGKDKAVEDAEPDQAVSTSAEAR